MCSLAQDSASGQGVWADMEAFGAVVVGKDGHAPAATVGGKVKGVERKSEEAAARGGRLEGVSERVLQRVEERHEKLAAIKKRAVGK